MARNAALPSAARGVLFVLKTPFFAKKIQKHEILPYKKQLFSVSVQNEEIPYKNSWFRNFFVRNSLFLGFLHQTGELRKHSHAREQERPGVGTCAPIPVLFVTRGVINKFSQLSPGSLFIAWVSATKQTSHTHKLSTAWVSATKQTSHTHKLFTLRRKRGTGGRSSGLRQPYVTSHAPNS